MGPASLNDGHGLDELRFRIRLHQYGRQTSYRMQTLTETLVVTLVFCLGNLDDATNSPFGQPYVEVLYNATRSRGATIVLTLVMFVLLVSCAVNTVTTSSRQLWSFARDGGPPFSAWLSRVRPNWDV